MAKRSNAAQPAPDIEPLDVDGVRTVSLLTLLWGVAFVILVVRRTILEAEGNGWWLWTCMAGVGLGLLGVEYTRRRRDAIEDAQLQAEAEEEIEDVPVGDEAPHPTQAYDTGAVPPSASNVTRPIPPHATGQQQAVTGQQAVVTGQQAAVTGQQAAVPPSSTTKPVPPVREPHVTGQQRPVTGQQPVVRDKPLPRRAPRAAEQQLPRTAQPAAKPEDAGATTGSFPRLDDESREFSAYRPRRARPGTEPTTSQQEDSDDEPLLETTLGGGRRARRAGGDQQSDPEESVESDASSDDYRGRRRRRDAS